MTDTTKRAELLALADRLTKQTRLEVNDLNAVRDYLDADSVLHHEVASTLRRLAAQGQKPVAWHNPTDDVTPFVKPYVKEAMLPHAAAQYSVPLYLSPPPAAGWDGTALTELADRINTAHRRGVSCVISHTELMKYVTALRRNAPPDSGAGKLETELPPLTCDFAQALPGGKLDDSTYSKIEDALDKIEAPVQDASGKWLSLYERIAAIALPDHGGADAGVGELHWPEGITPATLYLVKRFAVALAKKLRLAEEKYGYSDGWSRYNWESECRDHLYQHLAKGDPRDVAAYCAFMWHHGWITSQPAPVAANASAVLQNDLAEMLRTLGMSDAAQPKSPHEVFQSAIAEMKRQIANASAEARWRSISEDTSWLDGRDVVLLANDMEVQARYCPGEWSDETPNTPREYSGAVWSCFDDQFQLEIEECSHDPSEWGHDGATHWRPVYAHSHASDCDKQEHERELTKREQYCVAAALFASGTVVDETTKFVETPETNAIDPASVSKQPVSGAPSSPAGRDRPSDRTADVTATELARFLSEEYERHGSWLEFAHALLDAYGMWRR